MDIALCQWANLASVPYAHQSDGDLELIQIDQKRMLQMVTWMSLEGSMWDVELLRLNYQGRKHQVIKTNNNKR